jgi:hypothetical protein
LNLLEAINYISEAWIDVSQNTISNCWIKTGILPSINYIQREVSSDQIDIEFDIELEDIEDLLDNLPAPFLDTIQQYTKQLEELPTEEFLNDKQIIEFITRNPNEEIISDSESELELINFKEAAQGLKKFITFFSQQSDNSNYNCEDLKVFRKYLKLMNLKLIEDKKQTSINTFYSIAE